MLSVTFLYFSSQEPRPQTNSPSFPPCTHPNQSSPLVILPPNPKMRVTLGHGHKVGKKTIPESTLIGWPGMQRG